MEAEKKGCDAKSCRDTDGARGVQECLEQKKIERGMGYLNGYRKEKEKEKLINSLKLKKREDANREMQTVRKIFINRAHLYKNRN